MIKKSLVALAVTFSLVTFSGCGKKEIAQHEKVTINKGQVATKIAIGSNLDTLNLKDQFDKNGTISASTKKAVFAFTKPTGHLVIEYLNSKNEDFLAKNNIQVIADVSRIPSLILNYVVLSDLQKSKYQILMFLDEKVSAEYRNEKNPDSIMVVTLDNLKVTGVSFVTSLEDFKKEIE